MFEGEEEAASAGFRAAVTENMSMLGDADVVLISNTCAHAHARLPACPPARARSPSFAFSSAARTRAHAQVLGGRAAALHHVRHARPDLPARQGRSHNPRVCYSSTMLLLHVWAVTTAHTSR